MNDGRLGRKIRFYEKLAEAWTASGIEWAICNGLADYPDGIGRDLDVVTSSSDRRSALETTFRVMVEEGFTPLAFRLGWVHWTVGFRWHDGKVESVQVDLFDHLQWAFTWVVDGAGRFGKIFERGPFREDPAASVGKRLLINALSGNFSTLARKPAYTRISERENEVLPALVGALSGRPEPSVVEALRGGDLTEIQLKMAGYRRRVMWHSLSSPRRWLKRMHSAFQKQWEINFFPARAVPIVSIESPDPSIQTQITEAFLERVREELVFCNVDVYSNRPHFLFRRSVRRPFQVLADYLVGDRLRMRRASALQVLQCFDGHVAALSLWPGREGISCFPKWMAKLVRRPDLSVFVLGEDHEPPAIVADLKVDEVFCSTGGASAAADRIFQALISRLEELSRIQCRRLGLPPDHV